MITPIDTILWALAALAVVLIFFVIFVVIFLLVSMIRRAVARPVKSNDHNIIVHSPKDHRGR